MDGNYLENAIAFLRELEKMGYEACLCGGAVRDLVMKRPAKDLDIATNCPEEILAAHYNVTPIGNPRGAGIMLVHYQGLVLEVSQFRDGDSFLADAKHRDFTINAMAMKSDGSFLNVEMGRRDIEEKIIRAVDDAGDRFREDWLRMLRAIRFAAALDFTIDDSCLVSIRANSARIKEVAAERILKELQAMAALDGPRFARAIVLMDETGLLEHILPEIAAMKSFPHSQKHHPEGPDVFTHTLAAIRQNKQENSPILNFCLLFHDVGKIASFVEKNGKPTYYGHDLAGSKMLEGICRRLMLPTRETKIIRFCARWHMLVHDFLATRNRARLYDLMRDEGFPFLLETGRCDEFCRRGASPEILEHWKKIGDRLEAIRNMAETNPLFKKITGRYISQKTGAKGAELGFLLERAREMVLNQDIREERVLLNVLNMLCLEHARNGGKYTKKYNNL